MYYRNASAAVIVYDITSLASLDKAKSWIKELQRQADPTIVVCLVGNKADLAQEAPERRMVQREDAEQYAQDEGLLFFETSAKTGENVKEVFEAIGGFSSNKASGRG